MGWLCGSNVTNELRGFEDSLLASLCDDDLVRAKTALTKHVGKVTLTPVMRDGRPVYKARGNLTLDADCEKCRKQLVARDGIEPTTPAFTSLWAAQGSRQADVQSAAGYQPAPQG